MVFNSQEYSILNVYINVVSVKNNNMWGFLNDFSNEDKRRCLIVCDLMLDLGSVAMRRKRTMSDIKSMRIKKKKNLANLNESLPVRLASRFEGMDELIDMALISSAEAPKSHFEVLHEKVAIN